MFKCSRISDEPSACFYKFLYLALVCSDLLNLISGMKRKEMGGVGLTEYLLFFFRG